MVVVSRCADGEPCGRAFSTCRAAGKAYDLRRHQKTNKGTKNMGGRKGIGQKEQTQPDLGPAGLVQETLLNGCIRMADMSIFISGLVRFANMTIQLTDLSAPFARIKRK
jgi:hypothetical protein